MELATYYLSTAVSPDQFRNSEIFGEGKSFNAMACFKSERDGDFRVSLADYWGVIYFHDTGYIDVEIDYIPEHELTCLLQEISNTFFVRMYLHQPLHLDYLPKSVSPSQEKARKEM